LAINAGFRETIAYFYQVDNFKLKYQNPNFKWRYSIDFTSCLIPAARWSMADARTLYQLWSMPLQPLVAKVRVDSYIELNKLNHNDR